MQRRLATVLVALACAAGCSGAGSPRVAPPTAMSPKPVAAPSFTKGRPPVLHAQPLRYGRPGGPTAVKGRGHPVPPSAVTHRVPLATRVRVGLADSASYFGRVYMAISRDEGRTWTIDSPEFYYSAAQGPATTTALSRTPSGLVVAWGHGGNFVKITPNVGRSWFQTDFQDGVDTLTVHGNRLFVRELEFTTSGDALPDLTYMSDTRGRTWHLAKRG